jgi:hypothetical protein
VSSTRVFKSSVLTEVMVYNIIHFNEDFRSSPAMTMKNAVFWNVTECGSCKNREIISHIIFLFSVRPLLVKANVVPDSYPADDVGTMFLRNVGSYKIHTT